MDNLKSLFLSFVPSSPAFYLAFASPDTFKIVTSIVLPIVFFVISKTIDIALQVYRQRNAAKK